MFFFKKRRPLPRATSFRRTKRIGGPFFDPGVPASGLGSKEEKKWDRNGDPLPAHPDSSIGCTITIQGYYRLSSGKNSRP